MSNDKKRETVGKIASDLMLKAHNDKHTAKDQTLEQLSDYEKNISEIVDKGIKEYGPVLNKDFFVVVLTKKEKLMPNVIRNYFFHRTTCPTPNYDQTVYIYHHQSGALEYVWTVPNQESCLNMSNNALMVHPEQKELLNFVLSFYDGSLLEKAQRLNGEKYNAQMII